MPGHADFSALSGKVALVTGASRGIGRAVARRLAAHGVKVVVTASERSARGLDEARSLIEQAGGQAHAVVADLSEPEQRDRLMMRASGAFGPIDILVNNAAGIPRYAPPSTMPRADRRALFELNFHAPVDLIQQALPAMRDRRWGRVVNISSEMAQQPGIPYPGPAKMVHTLALYGAAKAALERYSEGLAAELHGSGVCVNTLAPTKIAMTESAAAVARQMAEQRPEWVEPTEMMAEAVAQLCRASLTGLRTGSRELLHLLQQPLLALDGSTVIGNALTLVDID